MRKVVLISLLLVSILADHQAQGIRFMQGSLSAKQHYNVKEEKSVLGRGGTVGFGGEGMIASEEGQGSESGSNRKLMTKTSSTSTTTTATTSKNEKNSHEGTIKPEPTLKGQSSSSERSVGGKEENLSINSSTVSHEHPPKKVPDDHYPDIIDIAGMDYSPARRKPPIHN